MKVLIFGGTGLIGTQLVTTLAQKNHEIIVLSRSPERAPSLPQNVKTILWDADTSSGCVEFLNGADAVINLAGESIAGKKFFPSPWTKERREGIRQSRVDVGRALLSGIQKVDTKPKVFIQASAIGYYGTAKDETFTEESPPGSDFLAETCKVWESSTKPVQDFGVSHIITRFGMVLSRKGGAFPRLLLPFQLFLGGPFGDGQQWYSWIHIQDVCRAIHFLSVTPGAEGIFNLTAPQPIKNKTFANVLGTIMKRPSFVPVPGFLMRWVFGDVSTVVLDSQRVIPQRLSDFGFTFQYPILEMALRDLLDNRQ
jgi:uncharacterized protein (TIGR01777 family)